MQIHNIFITPPDDLTNIDQLPLWDSFFFPLYTHIYSLLNPNAGKLPHIDFDSLKQPIANMLSNLSPAEARALRLKGGFQASTWKSNKENKAAMILLRSYPELGNVLQNIHLLSDIAIKSCEVCLGEKVSTENFIQAKQLIDNINTQRWSRAQTPNEQQSGVSNLGSISEKLLELALNALIDEKNFFRTSNQDIQSYGDFVLMCLPNNLWLSVKSNFARERLLASGYTTDILGVGFFTSKKEFTSQSKIRNFQRVGFLAMYLPDVPVSPEQVQQNTNTYDEVIEAYADSVRDLPKNINGTSFLRPLSSLHHDIEKMLNINDVKNRTTLSF